MFMLPGYGKSNCVVQKRCWRRVMITFKLEIFFIYQLFCLLREAEIYQLRVQALLLDFGFEFS